MILKTINDMSNIELDGYYYNGLAGDLQYLVVVKERNNSNLDAPQSSDLISNSRFLLRFRTKRMLRKLTDELLEVLGDKNANYTLEFSSRVKH